MSWSSLGADLDECLKGITLSFRDKGHFHGGLVQARDYHLEAAVSIRVTVMQSMVGRRGTAIGGAGAPEVMGT